MSRKIKKRGCPIAGHISIIAPESTTSKNLNVEDTSKNNTIQVGESTYSFIRFAEGFVIWAFLIILVVGCWYGWNRYKEECKEEAALNVKVNLQVLRYRNTVEYLQITNMKLEKELFVLDLYLPNMKTDHPLVNDSTLNEQQKDSLSQQLAQLFLLSIMTLNPDTWDDICHTLDDAKIDLNLHLPQWKLDFTIPHCQLLDMTSSSPIFNYGKDFFLYQKKVEVLSYARRHFYKDKVFDVDSVSVTSDFVTLHLNFDDRYRLGNTYLDTTSINAHFTDAVGDIGSIADNMLTICSLTNCGLAFEYVGRKKHQTYRWEWDTSRTAAYLKDYSGYIPYSKRKKNQVHTTIRKEEED